MITYYAITTFKIQLQALLKAKRNVYAGARDEIKTAFEKYR